ncbi:MAG: hypothetical protein U9O41_08215, partial [Candidatus Aerophobetes bacterium]|nr:hypothetical protein [Candidatus Aerophobetes bacterium]
SQLQAACYQTNPWDLVLSWWLTFTQARLSLAKTDKLYSAHPFKFSLLPEIIFLKNSIKAGHSLPV